MIKGIIFDKDGTLLDFNKMWLSAARKVIKEYCKMNFLPTDVQSEKRLLSAIGVEGDVIKQDGALAYMTYRQIGEVIAESFPEYGITREVAGKQIEMLFEAVIQEGKAECAESCDLHALLSELKNKGIKIGLVTADNKEVTELCLKKLGVEKEVFDYLGCDDGKTQPKPEPEMFFAFCSKCKLQPNQVAVVGDTHNDMKFAHNAGGMGIGVLCGLSNREDFAGYADEVIETPMDVLSLLVESRNI